MDTNQTCEREDVSVSGCTLQLIQQNPRNRHCGLTDDEASSILNYNNHDNLFLCSTGTSTMPAEVAGCAEDVDDFYEADPLDLSDEALYTKTPPHEKEAECSMHVFFDEKGCIFEARPPPPHEDVSEVASAEQHFASHQNAQAVRFHPCLVPKTRCGLVVTDF